MPKPMYDAITWQEGPHWCAVVVQASHGTSSAPVGSVVETNDHGLLTAAVQAMIVTFLNGDPDDYDITLHTGKKSRRLTFSGGTMGSYTGIGFAYHNRRVDLMLIKWYIAFEVCIGVKVKEKREESHRHGRKASQHDA